MGTLDLGGASTQLVFIPEKSNESSGLNNVKIYGIDYNLFSSSFLCWGANQITLIYQTYLLIVNFYCNSNINYSFN